MPDSFYEILGVPADATPLQVRGAYRRLVLKHHPDHAPEGSDPDIFHRITQAYEVLADPSRRREYDRLMLLRKEREAAQTKSPPPKIRPGPTAPKAPRSNPAPPKPNPYTDVRAQVVEELGRLTRLYAKGHFREAEALAREIVRKDPKQAVPFGILGDIVSARGDLSEASKFYAFAAQIDPRNPTYQRKHEALLGRINAKFEPYTPARRANNFAPGAAFALTLVAAAYVALAREPAAIPQYGWIGTWTLGLVVMLFMSGVFLGAGLSLGNYVEHFESLAQNSMNRISPALALASIAIVNFWAAAFLYALVGLRERSYTYSVSRVIASAGMTVLLFCIAAMASKRIDPSEVFLWGGNLVYVGIICGWMVADTLRE